MTSPRDASSTAGADATRRAETRARSDAWRQSCRVEGVDAAEAEHAARNYLAYRRYSILLERPVQPLAEWFVGYANAHPAEPGTPGSHDRLLRAVERYVVEVDASAG